MDLRQLRNVSHFDVLFFLKLSFPFLVFIVVFLLSAVHTERILESQ